jgi:hypothetical protein
MFHVRHAGILVRFQILQDTAVTSSGRRILPYFALKQLAALQQPCNHRRSLDLLAIAHGSSSRGCVDSGTEDCGVSVRVVANNDGNAGRHVLSHGSLPAVVYLWQGSWHPPNEIEAWELRLRKGRDERKSTDCEAARKIAECRWEEVIEH